MHHQLTESNFQRQLDFLHIGLLVYATITKLLLMLLLKIKHVGTFNTFVMVECTCQILGLKNDFCQKCTVLSGISDSGILLASYFFDGNVNNNNYFDILIILFYHSCKIY